MEWSDISSAVSKYAPLVATTLSSPIGAAIGAGTIIANMFGVAATPDSVMDYINNNPEKAQEKISMFEIIKERNRHEEQIKAIELQNIESARNNSKNVNESPVDNKIKIRALNFNMFMLTLFVGTFIFTIYWNLKYHALLDAGLSAMLGMGIGQFSAPIKDVMNYFFATSFSSKKKDDVIAESNRRP